MYQESFKLKIKFIINKTIIYKKLMTFDVQNLRYVGARLHIRLVIPLEYFHLLREFLRQIPFNSMINKYDILKIQKIIYTVLVLDDWLRISD
jgi:hypothetical protein